MTQHAPLNVPAGPAVGTAQLRIEDDRLLRGKARFIDDFPVPAGTLYISFWRSPYAHARITSWNVDAARAAEGVVMVLDGATLAGATRPMQTPVVPGELTLTRPNLAVDVVRYVGEPVFAVVATDPDLAEDALELIEADFESLPHVLDWDEAMAAGAPKVHEDLPHNIVFDISANLDGLDSIFASAAHVTGDRFHSDRVSAVAMECRGFLSQFDRGTGKLIHLCTGQVPHKVRWELSQALQLREGDVTVKAPQVGGSFGMKTVTAQEDVVGAYVAKTLGAPVKWMQDRPDDLATMHGRDFHFGVEIACDAEGRLLAVRGDFIVDIGAYPLWISTAGLDVAGAGHHMMGPYRTPAYGYRARSVVSNKAGLLAYRGVAAPICTLAMETLLNRVALRVGIDPVEIRRRNLIRPADLPYKNGVGVTHDTASHLDCLDQAIELSDYRAFKAEKSGKFGADGLLRGIGLATITDHTGQGSSIMRARGQATRAPGFDAATIRIEPDGSVMVGISLASQGQGHETAFAQIVADALGLPLKDIHIVLGDTSQTPFGTGTGASRGAVAAGSATMKAANHLARKLKRIAAHNLQVAPDDIELVEGLARVRGPSNMSLAIHDLIEAAYMTSLMPMPDGEEVGLDTLQSFDPPTSTYSNATHVVQVAVDPGTGRVAVERYVIVHDCGKVLNPLIVQGQIVGAVVQGIGSVLSEAVRYDEGGQPLTTTLIDYAIPTMADVPKIELHHIETPATTNPLGVKGAGEGGIVGAVPALTLAITDALSATGVEFTAVPILPPKIVDILATSPAL